MSDKELLEYLVRERENIRDDYWNGLTIYVSTLEVFSCVISELENRQNKPVINQEKEEEETMNDGMFLVVEASDTYKVCYETITGVMYLVSNGGQNFTVMVDQEGKPLTYYRWRRAKNNREKLEKC